MSIQIKTADATWGREEFELFQDAGFFRAFDVQDDGAYLNKGKLNPLGIIDEAETDELAWAPQYESPNGRLLGSPALPFKFGANQLAALMLDGEGWFLYDLATDPEAVAEVFAGVYKKGARDALAAAIEAMEAAENATGKRPKFSGNKNKPMIIKSSTPEERALRDDWVKKVARYEVEYKEWRRKMVFALLPPAAAPEQISESEPRQSQAERQAQRWKICVDEGLDMPVGTYAGFPRGITKVAKKIGITRQALTEDLNAHRERIYGKQAGQT